ncbi:helix-turn-helix domain-containing protein, partial [Candidatus Bathyarchaeota archaeon]
MSQVSHKQVLNLLLQGNTITEVAEMLDVSRTTIYNRRKDFLDYAEKEGILLAAEHFDV